MSHCEIAGLAETCLVVVFKKRGTTIYKVNSSVESGVSFELFIGRFNRRCVPANESCTSEKSLSSYWRHYLGPDIESFRRHRKGLLFQVDSTSFSLSLVRNSRITLFNHELCMPLFPRALIPSGRPCQRFAIAAGKLSNDMSDLSERCYFL